VIIMKRGLEVFLILMLVFAVLFVSGFVLAQDDGAVGSEDADAPSDDDGFDDFDEGELDDGEILDDIDEEFEDDSHEVDAGITEDSFLSFLDFDFGPAHEVSAEKAAEIAEMIEKGASEEDIRKALEKFEKFNKRFLENADPAEREEFRRNAAAIRKRFRKLDLTEEEREEFLDGIDEGLKKSATAVEISNKIKDLCEALSELGPLEYARTCKTKEGDGSQDWKRKLDDDLTKEQEKKAIEFGEIMTECFKTSGETCRCEDISFTEFAEECAIIAPLAYACDVLDDEDSCDKMDAREEEVDIFDLLPDYLQDVLDDIEDQYMEAEFDHHIPRACEDAGITGREDDARERCFKIMVEREAPKPCSDAIKSGRIKISNERAFREACEMIMFEEDAPRECIDAGIDNFRDCGEFMFSQNAPQECIDAGLTGEHRSDMRECERLTRDFDDHDRRGLNRGSNIDCGRIEDPGKRLECFDKALREAHDRRDDHDDFDRRFEDTMRRERQCADKCHSEDKAWDFSNGNCECHDGGRFDDRRDDYRDDYNYDGDYDDHRDDDFRGDFDCSVVDCFEGEYCDPYKGCVSNDYEDYGGGYDGNYDGGDDHDPTRGGDGTSCNEGYESDGDGGCIPFGSGDYGFDDPNSDSYSEGDYDEGFNDGEDYPNSDYNDGGGDSPSEEEQQPEKSDSEPTPEPEPDVTGGMITGNAFLDYYFK
jgi:hypothetical protein